MLPWATARDDTQNLVLLKHPARTSCCWAPQHFERNCRYAASLISKLSWAQLCNFRRRKKAAHQSAKLLYARHVTLASTKGTIEKGKTLKTNLEQMLPKGYHLETIHVWGPAVSFGVICFSNSSLFYSKELLVLAILVLNDVGNASPMVWLVFISRPGNIQILTLAILLKIAICFHHTVD